MPLNKYREVRCIVQCMFGGCEKGGVGGGVAGRGAEVSGYDIGLTSEMTDNQSYYLKYTNENTDK